MDLDGDGEPERLLAELEERQLEWRVYAWQGADSVRPLYRIRLSPALFEVVRIGADRTPVVIQSVETDAGMVTVAWRVTPAGLERVALPPSHRAPTLAEYTAWRSRVRLRVLRTDLDSAERTPDAVWIDLERQEPAVDVRSIHATTVVP